ncbi:MAG: caspase domain-containing protein [Pseudomonadales bacterium]
MASKHALIIGINKYPHMGKKAQLAGCVNDAKLMRNILIGKFNFDRHNIVELHNEAANRKRILQEMNRLVRRTKKDDIVVLHYSGHGARSTIRGGDGYSNEGSGKDNCILPADDCKPIKVSKRYPEGKEYREIRDDQINDWLTRLAQKTRYITLIFDACHSATMTRSSGDGTKARHVPESARPTQNKAPAPVSKKAIRKKGPGGWLALSNNYVVISGCRDMQTSKEKYFSESNGKRYKHGVLSYNLINAMTRAKPGTTYRDVFELACAGVVARVSGQNPQIEGRLDRELFGVKDIEPLRFIPVEKVSGNNVTLGGGAAQGLRIGSRWTAYPQGTKQTEGASSQGILQVSKVGALSSSATVISSSSPVKTGSRCVETQAVIEPQQLCVGLHALTTAQQALIKTGIQSSKLLTLASSVSDADVTANVLPIGAQSPVTGKNLTEASWAFHEDDELAMPLHPLSERGVAKLLVSNLETIARFRRTIALDNPVTNLNVEFNLYKRSASDKLKLANGGSTEFTEDDAMVLEVCNKEASRSVFISVLWMSANKEIGHFYPPRKSSEEIQAGKSIRIGHGKRKLRAKLAKNHPTDFGLETCKIFITTEASDFTWLNQQGTRSAAKKLKPLESAIRGNASKPVTKAKANGPDWDAINRSFILKRAATGKAKTKH